MTPQSGPGIFVDKDGTLVENVPYNVDPALLRFQPGVLQALAALASSGFAIVVVTNQSGVARGYFTCAQLGDLRPQPVDASVELAETPMRIHREQQTEHHQGDEHRAHAAARAARVHFGGEGFDFGGHRA